MVMRKNPLEGMKSWRRSVRTLINLCTFFLSFIIDGLAEGHVNSINNAISTTNPISNVVSTALSLAGGADAIKENMSAFAEHSAVLIKALDEVAKLHPFVGGMLYQTLLPLKLIPHRCD
jgi:hypothetical protein